MTMLRAALGTGRGRILAGAIGLYLGWQLWLTLAAPAKVAEELRSGRSRVNVQVTLAFPPERFHVLAMSPSRKPRRGSVLMGPTEIVLRIPPRRQFVRRAA